jgi:glutamate--cysteine ligase
MEAYIKAPAQGLSTELEGKKLYEWAEIFFKIAENGLIKREKRNSENKDETIYLKHIEDIIKKKTNRAQILINKYKTDGNLDFLNDEKEDFSYSGL